MSAGNNRILLVDDTPTIHEDFRKILNAGGPVETDLGDIESALFGEGKAAAQTTFELDSAYQGEEGLAKLTAALASARPYAMAFVDMRMPPGWDGVETIEHLWQKDPCLQIVICTAYSDYSWDEVLNRLDAHDRLLILKKPFDNIEVRQLASTLTAKWEMGRLAKMQMESLEDAVRQRTNELTQTNQALEAGITARKQLEGQLVQSEKLASIGQLAAGVAHEINNPIGYIFSNFGTLERYLDSLFALLGAVESMTDAGDAAMEKVKGLCSQYELEFLREDIPILMRESKEGIARVRQIVQDLKDFSRVDAAQEWQWANLHHGIDSTLNIVASEIKYKANVVKEYGQLPDIECLPSQLNQVVMNLVVNAAHAINGERGVITVRTGVEGEIVWLEVSDTGCGMSPETMARVFDPFFTTKPVGKGTGLGLSLSYGIVQKHSGRIEVKSTLGEGTTFRVALPVRQTEVAPKLEAIAA
jgi:signal transduction histidine kinase